VTFVRTVLGDIDPSEIGVTYSHEHVIIDGGRPVELQPDLELSDVEAMTRELLEAKALGLRTVVDAMPCDAGRNVEKLADVSRRAGIHLVAPTGLHHARYYGPGHWSERATIDELAELFAADVTDGIDERDYSGPIVRRTEHKAGVLKVAGSEGGPSERDTRIFAAAALTQARTGVPILTHCEGGTGALEQMQTLIDAGADPSRIVLSHVDKVVDRGYHREIVATGATVEYDHAFRWGDAENGTLTVLGWMVEDGLDGQVVLGLDAARQRYLHAYGGEPGLAFLLGEFRDRMTERGIDEVVQHRFFVENPARVFAFAEVRQ
jgi:predicted metal-dependent phosphotriesterase family hydrolase